MDKGSKDKNPYILPYLGSVKMEFKGEYFDWLVTPDMPLGNLDSYVEKNPDIQPAVRQQLVCLQSPLSRVLSLIILSARGRT